MYKKSLSLLEEIICNEFDDDGIHLCRLPSTQLSILGDMVTMRDIMMSANYDVPDFLSKQIKKSSHSLRFLEYWMEHCQYSMVPREKINLSLIGSLMLQMVKSGEKDL